MCILATLGACGSPVNREPPARSDAERAQLAAERDYLAPPRALSVKPLAGGRIGLTGAAPPAVRIRLGSPGGETLLSQAGSGGIWRIVLPPSDVVRLYGLSMIEGDRVVQAEGYVAVTPQGEGALLRAGSGAEALAPPAAAPGLLSLDYDRKGAAMLSGLAPPGARIEALDGGATVALGRADPSGRFALALNQPLRFGAHNFSLSGVKSPVRVVSISPPIPSPDGPFRAERLAGAWRIDWLTPGGGLQSTVLFFDARTPI